jgi:hypothetical protein
MSRFSESGLLQARVSGLVNRLTAEFALSNKQREAVREYCNSLGIEYVDSKADIVRMQPRRNAAGALLAALRDDWQVPVSIAGAIESDGIDVHRPSGIIWDLAPWTWSIGGLSNKQRYRLDRGCCMIAKENMDMRRKWMAGKT